MVSRCSVLGIFLSVSSATTSGELFAVVQLKANASFFRTFVKGVILAAGVGS